MINNLKKYVSGYVLFSLMMFTYSHAQVDTIQEIPKELWSLDENTVKAEKEIIAKKLLRNKYERIGVLCASTAVIVALGWYTFKSPDATDEVVTVAMKDQIEQMNKKMNILLEQNKQKTVNETINSNKQFPKTTAATGKKPSIITEWGSGLWCYGKRMGQDAVDNVVLLVLMGGLPGPINKLFNFWGSKLEELGNRVYHDADFHWFVTKQTQAVAYFNDLERAAALLPLANDEEEREHQRISMMWSADVLIKQLAKVVAFMEYQADQMSFLNTGCSIQMNASARYVYRHTKQFGHTLEIMLDDHTKHAEIPAYITSFRERLRSEQDSFCVNEHAALYDISDTIA